MPSLRVPVPFLTLSLLSSSASVMLAQAPVPINNLTIQVQSGAAPIDGVQLQIYKADLTSNTPSSTPLLPPRVYVSGSYTVSGVSCNPGSLYYLAITPGLTNNPALTLMTAVGSCNTLATTPTIVVNEVTTVASVYALSGFMTSLYNVGAKATPTGGANDAILSANALSGITNAFATTNNLADITTGNARTTTVAGNGTVPQNEINSLANALAPCVQSTTGIGNIGCTTLFANSIPPGGSGGDIVQSVLNIAHYPAANVAGLYALANSGLVGIGTPCKPRRSCTFVRATAYPYSPVLTAVPNDWTIVVPYTNAAIVDATSIAVDGSGDVWITNAGTLAGSNSIAPLTASVIEFANNGTVLSGAGYKAPSFGFANGITIDPFGNAWATAYGSKNVVEFAPDGSVLFNSTNPAFQSANGLAIDGAGDVWVPISGPGDGTANVTEFANSGALLTNIPGYTIFNSDPFAIAIDQAGAAWFANFGDSNVSKLNAQGKTLSGRTGFTANSLGLYPAAIAIDGSGNAWVESSSAPILTEFSTTGTVLSGSGFPVCVSQATVQCTTSFFVNSSVAIDGAGNVWSPFSYNSQTSVGATSGLAELNNKGTILSGPTGYANDTAITVGGIAIDNSGNVWSVSAKNLVREVIGAAVPVVTPLATGVKTAMLGSRP